MEIAILSDIHNHSENLSRAFQSIQNEGISTVIFCGNFCSPEVIEQMGLCSLSIHAVFGDRDIDRESLKATANRYKSIYLYGEYIGSEENSLTLDDIRFGVSHYSFYAKAMIKTGWFDVVCYGHSEKAHRQKFGISLLLNPGSIAGIDSEPSYAIYETKMRSSRIVLF
ncbi:MAG: YfcE family phosphodiesterase [Bacteroidetes bacterium]|nr:YfcE family phosphodiesterase [Bacteroidota bacterium]